MFESVGSSKEKHIHCAHVSPIEMLLTLIVLISLPGDSPISARKALSWSARLVGSLPEQADIKAPTTSTSKNSDGVMW
jgi:hypothetical protein